jgi:protocatechuate 3,4-dioxygenase beta subunit
MRQRFCVDALKRLGPLACAALLVLVSAGAALSQGAARTQRQGSGSVAGRATVDGEPARGLRLVLRTASNSAPAGQSDISLQTLTDDAGNFRLAGLPAGTFTLSAVSGAYVVPGDGRASSSSGKAVTVREGEEVKDVELALKRGGVITGRLTDAEGRPLVGARVSLQLVDENGDTIPVGLMNQPTDSDDRGVYRLYGLPAGRYVVALGPAVVPERRSGGASGSRAYYTPVYYPGVTDKSQAKVVEVRPGSEVTDVDISRGRRAESHRVAGRVVDGETGAPVPNVEVGYADASKPFLPSRGAGVHTNDAGEFRVENVPTGRYVAYAVAGTGGDSYSEAAPFEVSSDDVQGLQVKVRRGTTVSGVAVVEGVNDPAVLAKLSTVTVSTLKAGDQTVLSGARATLGPDGSFRLTGVPPGRIALVVTAYPSRDFTLNRVEQGGVVQPSGMLQVAPGEQMNGVKLVLSYGRGNVTGQVTPQNGTLPAGTRVTVNVTRANTPGRLYGSAVADPAGHFVITNVPAGSYDLVVRTSAPTRLMVKKPITVFNGKDTEAAVVIDMAQQQQQAKP